MTPGESARGRGPHDRPVAWVTGAGGLLGSALVQAARRRPLPWTVRGLTREDLELTDAAAMRRLFRADRPAGVIHCAALTSSPGCQADPGQARRLNVEVTERLADLAADVPFLFFSTDLVFDGRQGAYTETDQPHPLSVYAETKHEAEQIVLRNPRHTVIRTSLNGGTSPTGDRGFNEQMRLAWQRRQTLNLFVDEFRAPIVSDVTARAAWELLGQQSAGLYHVCGAERLSRYQIGRLLAARWPQLQPKLTAGSLKDYAGAPRAPDTCLDCTKAQALLSFPLPGLTEWLAAHRNVVF